MEIHQLFWGFCFVLFLTLVRPLGQKYQIYGLSKPAFGCPR